jgi:predicted glycoside hydrolase/deacetylase ChbG (UPF0249 family)
LIIVNADDWGRSPAETNAAADCFRSGSITSVTAMVFMQDSERGAELANELRLDVGLHLNLSQPFTAPPPKPEISERHLRITSFLTSNKYALVLYHPLLRHSFDYIYKAQVQEFWRLYGCCPSHVDGHHHKHLCANMLFDGVIPAGERVRRNFHYWKGQKNALNRLYRKAVDRVLARRYRTTDYLFSLSECLAGRHVDRVFPLARTATVELMTHPVNGNEHAYLLSDEYLSCLACVEAGTFATI